MRSRFVGERETASTIYQCYNKTITLLEHCENFVKKPDKEKNGLKTLDNSAHFQAYYA
jgi:hypothetical protein